MKRHLSPLFLHFGILLLGSFGANQVPAQTDAKTIQFLRKLSLYYYCPSREGLKGFSCDMTLTVSDVYKQSLIDIGVDKTIAKALDGQKFFVSGSRTGKSTVSWIPPTPTGNTTFDSGLKEQAESVQGNLESLIDNWVDNVFRPLFYDATFNQDCSVSNYVDGFFVDVKTNDGSDLRGFFDKKARQTKILMIKNGKTIASGITVYGSVPKGFLLYSMEMDMPAMELHEEDHYFYAPVGKYYFPKKATKELRLGKMFRKGSTLTLETTSYNLTQSFP